MATQHADLSDLTATNLTSTMSLSSGERYVIQAQGQMVFLVEASSAPTPATAAAHIIAPPDAWTVKQGTDNLYAWGKGRVVVTEAG